MKINKHNASDFINKSRDTVHALSIFFSSVFKELKNIFIKMMSNISDLFSLKAKEENYENNSSEYRRAYNNLREEMRKTSDLLEELKTDDFSSFGL